AQAAGEFDWVIFTSANGVQAFFAELRSQGADARRLGRARVAAIGPATAERLRAVGIEPDLVPEEYRGEAVADAIARGHGGRLQGVSVLLPRAEVAREALPEMLNALGARVTV